MPIKKLKEDRAKLINKARAIIDSANAEQRQLTAEERTEFDSLKQQVEDISGDINRMISAKEFSEDPIDSYGGTDPLDKNIIARDVHSVAAMLRARANGDVSNANFGTSNNPYLIPTTIADRIERRVAELAPIYNLATKYNRRGTFVIPVIDTSTDNVTVAYSTEFVAPDPHAPATSKVELNDFQFSALAKISIALIDGTDIEIVDQFVEYVAEQVAIFENHESIVGTANKSAGICGSYDSTNMAVTLADKDEITGDSLKQVKMMLPSFARKDARYLMNPDTLMKIALLKDGEGRYLFDVDNDKLCGLPVETDENMPKLGTNSKDVVFCGDFSGLAMKKAVPNRIQILDQPYAAEGALGILAIGYIDAAVSNKQKIAGIRTPAA